MIDAMKQALEALEEYGEHYKECRYVPYKTLVPQPPCTCGYKESVIALRQAIAEAEKQQDGAWMYPGTFRVLHQRISDLEAKLEQAEKESTLQEISDIGQEIEQEPVACECHRCIKENDLRDGAFPLSSTKMVLCHECGNKRCPKASDHRLACTGSNESGQAGSIYTAPPKQEQEIFIGTDLTADGMHLVIRRGNEIIHSQFYEAPKREWAGLTDDDIDDVTGEVGFGYIDVARAIEAKLKEKNA
jgi:Zn finger protein HypA/HybF involved in hydrogenase expression